MYKLSQTVSLTQSSSTNFIKYFLSTHTFCACSLSKMEPASQFVSSVTCSMFSFTKWIHKECFIRIFRHFLQTMYLAHTVHHAEIHKATVDESWKPWNLSDKQWQNKPVRVVGLYSTSDQMWSDQPLQSSEEWGLYNTIYTILYYLMTSHSYIFQSIHHILKHHKKNTYITVHKVCIQNSRFIVNHHSKRYKVYTIINNFSDPVPSNI